MEQEDGRRGGQPAKRREKTVREKGNEGDKEKERRKLFHDWRSPSSPKCVLLRLEWFVGPIIRAGKRGGAKRIKERMRTGETVAALHQIAPGQMTWLEDSPPWLMTWLEDRPVNCFASEIVWIFWTRNDLAPLLCWRLHLMTCLTTLVTWKWPGCLDVLEPPLWRKEETNMWWCLHNESSYKRRLEWWFRTANVPIEGWIIWHNHGGILLYLGIVFIFF